MQNYYRLFYSSRSKQVIEKKTLKNMCYVLENKNHLADIIQKFKTAETNKKYLQIDYVT